MEIQCIADQDIVTLILSGRIDTITSPKFQEEILKAFQKGNHLILDFNSVEYISSAGLRVLLVGQKNAESKNGSMKLIHVNEDVHEVLEMTGFIDILTIE